jgi:hypothetical protein
MSSPGAGRGGGARDGDEERGTQTVRAQNRGGEVGNGQ